MNYAVNVKKFMPNPYRGFRDKSDHREHEKSYILSIIFCNYLDKQYNRAYFILHTNAPGVHYDKTQSQNKSSQRIRLFQPPPRTCKGTLVSKQSLLRSSRFSASQIRDAALCKDRRSVQERNSKTFWCLSPSAFARAGLAGLLLQQRGPKEAHKLDTKVMAFIETWITKDQKVRARELAELVRTHFNLLVHPRSIERALARKKKLRNRPN